MRGSLPTLFMTRLVLKSPGFIHAGIILAAALLFITVLPLQAHHLPPGMEDVDEFEDMAAFAAGLRHPWLSVDHWLFAIMAGAVVGLARKQKAGVLMASIWVGSLALGGWMGTAEWVLPYLGWSSWLALGAGTFLLTLGTKLPLMLQMAILALAALWQGNDHGAAWPLDTASMAYLGGMLAASLGLACAGACVVKAASSASARARRWAGARVSF